MYKRILEIVDPVHGHEEPYNGLDPFQTQKNAAIKEAIQPLHATVSNDSICF
jgi:hypothetical protein